MLGAAPREELLERFGHLLGGQPFLPPAAPRAVQPRAQQRTVQRAPAVMVRAEGGGRHCGGKRDSRKTDLGGMRIRFSLNSLIDRCGDERTQGPICWSWWVLVAKQNDTYYI